MITVDKEFHWTLVKAIGNTEFARPYNVLHDRQLRIGMAMFTALPRWRCSAVEQHQEIVNAIAEFDLELAFELLQVHLVSSDEDLAKY